MITISARTPRSRPSSRTRNVVGLLLVSVLVSMAAAVGLSSARPTPISAQEAVTAAGAPLSKDWKRMRSGEFEIVGNASVDEMKLTVVSLTAFRAALLNKFPGLRLTSPVPTVIVLFKDNGAYAPFKPRDDRGRREEFVGYFAELGDMNVIVLPATTTGAGSSLQTVFHEYVHFVLSRNSIDLPPWLHEGLAEFYSSFTFDPKQGRGVAGHPPPGRLDWLRSRPLLPLDAMLGTQSALKLIRDPDKAPLFYSQAWAMVHYLMLARPTRSDNDIQAYLALLQEGVSIERAFQQAFGAGFAGLRTELDRYVTQPSFPGFYVSVSPDIVADAKAEALNEAESLFIRGDLLARLEADDEAEKVLSRLFALQPDHARGRVALAVVKAHQKRFKEALALVEPIAASPVADFRSNLVLGRVHVELEQIDAALVAFRRATKLNAAATAGWVGRAVTATAAGLDEESDEAMTRLQALQPSPQWFRVRAEGAYHRQKFATAARDARAYVERAGPGNESSPYVAFLGATAHGHIGQPEEAARLLAAVSPAVTAGSWPAVVMAFMEGRLSAAELLQKADDAGEKTEAHAYVGIRAGIADRPSEATEHLRWVIDKGSKSYVEYRMAESELKWLGAGQSPRR